MPISLLKNKPPGRVLAQSGACLYAPLAQLVEQLTLNQWVLGSSPRWCTTKYLARSCGVFFYCLFLRELPFVHHWEREWLAVEVTAACGGDRDPEQAQRSQRTSPAHGAQADAVTASRRPAVRPAGQKQSSGRFLERGGFYASPRICLISAKSAAK